MNDVARETLLKAREYAAERARRYASNLDEDAERLEESRRKLRAAQAQVDALDEALAE